MSLANHPSLWDLENNSFSHLHFNEQDGVFLALKKGEEVSALQELSRKFFVSDARFEISSDVDVVVITALKTTGLLKIKRV